MNGRPLLLPASTCSISTVLLVLACACSAVAQPQLAWQAFYNGPTNSTDLAEFVAADLAGNVFVSGISYGTTTQYDWATVKYDPNGNELWVRRYNGGANQNDWVNALVVDKAGNAYVAGYSEGSDSQRYTTIKYDPSGCQLWVVHSDGPSRGGRKNILSVDDLENVYVAVTGVNSHSKPALTTIKYDSNGNEKWAGFYDVQGIESSSPAALTLDKAGNVYVTGATQSSLTGLVDFITVKYNSEGRQLWASPYNGPGNQPDIPSAL